MRRLALLRLAFSRRLDESLAALIRDAVRAARPVRAAERKCRWCQPLAETGLQSGSSVQPEMRINVRLNSEPFEAVATKVVQDNLRSLGDAISKQRG